MSRFIQGFTRGCTLLKRYLPQFLHPAVLAARSVPRGVTTQR